MSPSRKALIAISLTVATVAGTALVTAPPASAATRCNTSHHSVSDPVYSGPYPDSWDFSVQLCASRSGGTVSGWANISWDGPNFWGSCDDTKIFDEAAFRLQLKKSVANATDPVKRYATYYGFERHLENSTSSCYYNGSTSTPTLSYSFGSSRGLADGEILLNWRGVGHRQTVLFTASPVV